MKEYITYLWNFLKHIDNKALIFLVIVLSEIYMIQLQEDGVVSHYALLGIGVIFGLLAWVFWHLAKRKKDEDK